MRDSTIGRALRHWHWLIWAIALFAGTLAFGVSWGRQPTYEASALVSIDQTQETGQGFDVAMQTDQFLSQRFISMATSRAVFQKVCAQEGSGCSPTALTRQVQATTLKATSQIQILADASTPQAAARLANDVADAMVARNRELVDAQMASQRMYLQDQVKQLNDQIAQTVPLVPGNEGMASHLAVLQTQYSNVSQRLQDLQLQQSKLESVIAVTDRAAPPSRPADPDPLRYVLVGVAGGLVAGALAALVVERSRDRMYDSSELAEATGSQIVLDLSHRQAARATNPFGFLAHAIVAGQPPKPQALLLAAISPPPDMKALALGLAQAVAAHQKRILVELGPILEKGSAERFDVPAGPSSSIVVMFGARSELQPGEEFDVTIRAVEPPVQHGGYAWSQPPPSRAILVARRRRSRFSEARRTAELLRHVGVEIVGTVLMPARLDASPEIPVPEPERAPRQAAAAEQ